jgi:signal transduction histidine kinase/GAF domain-containing protein
VTADARFFGVDAELTKRSAPSDVVRWLEVALIQDLNELLDAIVHRVPETVGARDCSIYLLPQFVNHFDGVLTDGDLVEMSYASVNENFIVSARSTKPSPNRPYGKSFYVSGEGLTGWVFEQRRPLLLQNMWDEAELKQFTPIPKHSDKYGLGRELGSLPQPFLAMPLQTAADEPVGVLKLTGTLDSLPFPSDVQEFLQPVVRALTDLIQRTALLERMKAMKKLMATLAAAASMRDVLRTAVVETPALVDASHCSIFLLDEKTGYYVLRATTSDLLEAKVDVAHYQPGEGLTGWVASRKCPLRLTNLGDAAELQAVDPDLRWLDKDEEYAHRPTRQFLAAPLLSTRDSEPVLGVIRFPEHRFNQSFTAADEALLVEFATSFVPILEAVRVREHAEMISASKEMFLALTLDRERLLKEAVKSTDRILTGDGCSLFLRDDRSRLFVLNATTAPTLEPHIGSLAYAEGEGKTGRVIEERRPLRLNPVEEPPESVKDSAETDIQTGAKFLAAPLLADNGDPMGVIRVTRQRDKPDFTQVDENLLSSIASMVGLSLRTLAAHETKQQIARALLSVAETNVRLVRDQQRLPFKERRQQPPWLALTTVTWHDGLRFNRAALLTHTDERNVIGVCAIGPETLEDADQLWTDAKSMSFDELLRLNAEEAGNRRGFHNVIANLQLTLGPDEPPDRTLPFAACLGRHAYRVQDGKVETLTADGFVESDCIVQARFVDLVACNSFALIPFAGLDGHQGVLYVDNRFTGRPIAIDQLRPLAVFADFFATSMSLAAAQDSLLLRSARLATLGEFAVSFSHQARQPMQIINTALQLMEGYPPRDRDELNRRLTELREGVDGMHAALRYLDRIAGRGSPNPQESVNVKASVRSVAESVSSYLEAIGITVRVNIPDELPEILVDRGYIEDILRNLIANARDAMEQEGGELTVTVSAYAGAIDIEVSDTGCGIAESDHEAIFKPLFSTKPMEKGMGMGLALSRRLAEEIGGSLRVGTPCDGRGATFVLHIETGEPRS